MKQFKFTGSLYQLVSRTAKAAGAYVEVNGPHDTFGYIVNSKQQGDGHFLNLIRGCAARPGVRPVACF